MNFTLWISFVGTVIILAITPGPSVLLATANAMNYGVKKTFGTIFGDLSANLLQIILASLGLATIIVASGEIFQIIKWLGVAYLIFLGVKKIIDKPKVGEYSDQKEERSFKSLYKEGFLMSAANPKAIVFFAALFPLFIDETLPLLIQIVILAITFLTIDGLSLYLYAKFSSRLKRYLVDQKKVHLQNRIIGFLLILSGIMLSTVKRANT